MKSEFVFLQDSYLFSDRTHYKNENVLSGFSAEVSPNEHAVLNVTVSLRHADESVSNKHMSIRSYAAPHFWYLHMSSVLIIWNLEKTDTEKKYVPRKAMRLNWSPLLDVSLKMSRVIFMKAWRRMGRILIIILFCFVFWYILTVAVMWMCIYMHKQHAVFWSKTIK